ncbi:MAG: DUF4831 family protein [Bacteroidales bacterium]|nr:DUF4831 family protein [Bacteroidales bacterium]
MKNRSLSVLLAGLLISGMLSAQQYKSFPINSGKDNNGIVYSLPQTDLVIKFKAEKITRTKGIYSESAYLLGIDNAALKNNVSYRITGAEIQEKVSPNPDKRYILETDGKTEVERTATGMLKSIKVKGSTTVKNGDIPQDKRNAVGNQHKEMQNHRNNNTVASLEVRPTYEQRLMQQGLLTKYPQMSAEKVVVEIKKLREKQIELLSGSLEGTFMNTTVDYMYKQLDEIIASYVALFTGTETVTEEEYVFEITPEKPIILEEDLLIPVCKFSPSAGFMDLNEKGEGTKINARIHSYISTEADNKNKTEKYMSDKQKSKLEKEGAGIYYIIPQTVKVTLQGTDMVNTSKMVNLMQYGNVSFTTSHNMNIIFDDKTGELLLMQ